MMNLIISILRTCFLAAAIMLLMSHMDAQVTVAGPIRLEETIAINDKANEPFFRAAEHSGERNHTVSLVIQGIINGQLRPLTISDDHQSVQTLDYDEWLCKMQARRHDVFPWDRKTTYKADPDPKKVGQCVYKGRTYMCIKDHNGKRPDQNQGSYWTLAKDPLVHAQNFSVIKLDLTRGTLTDGSIVERVNYITFCDEDKFSPNGLIMERFSLKWSDFIKYLERRHADKLYYITGYGPWYKNEIFLTHNYYWQDYYGIPPLSFIPSNNIVLTNIMTGQRNTTAELKELYAKEGEGQISLDRQKGRIQSIQLRIKVPNKQMETYNIPWQDYTHAMTDSNHTRKAKALKLVDAWLTKLFVYDESIKLIYGGDTDEMQNEKTISRGGYFKGTHKKDPLCRSNITSSFTSTKPAVEKLSVSLLEEVSLGDTNNQLLFSGKWPLQSLVREYVLAGKLKSIRAYDTTAKEYLSLANAEKSKNYYAISDLKRQLTQDYPAYNIKDKYRKGDIVLFEGRHYKALQNPGDREPADSSALLLKVWEKVQPQQYDPKQLYLLQTHLNCHFDTTGKLTAHQLEYVELILPESENLKGVDKPLLVVNWDALRNLLIADPRAKVKKGAKVVNYADILEQRAYKAWILKTGFLKGGE